MNKNFKRVVSLIIAALLLVVNIPAYASEAEGVQILYFKDFNGETISNMQNEGWTFTDGFSKYAEIVSDFGCEDSTALKINRTKHWLWGTLNPIVGMDSPYIEVTPGELYTASADIYMEKGHLGIRFYFLDEDKKSIEGAYLSDYTTSNYWENISNSMVAPENARYAQITYVMNADMIATGYYDNIMFTKGVIWPKDTDVVVKATQNNTVDGYLVKPNGNALTYNSYNEYGDKLSDFSYAGFYEGQFELPNSENLPVAAVISPSEVEGTDDTSRIQAVINSVAENSSDNVFKVIKLEAGRYYINKNGLKMKSGIILSGEGQGPNGTVLYAYQPTTANLQTSYTVRIEGTKATATGENHYLKDDYIEAGSREFTIDEEEAKTYAVGDLIAIYSPQSDEWFEEMEMSGITNPDGIDTSWTSAKMYVKEERTITGIDGGKITVDMPFYVPYTPSLTNTYIYKINDSGRIKNVGIENLRFESYFDGSPKDEKHATFAINASNAKDCYIRDVSSKYYAIGLFQATTGAKRITVKNCSCLEPVSTNDGSRRYSYSIGSDAQQILITGCYSYNGRHDYVATNKSVGPIVFTDSVGDSTNTNSETHGLWAIGTLYDNVYIIGLRTGGLATSNYGKLGDSKTPSFGWTGVGSVFYNCLSPAITAVKPRLTYNNFMIGQWGYYDNEDSLYLKQKALESMTNNYRTSIYADAPEGVFVTEDRSSFIGDAYKEAQFNPVEPRALYKAQLAERLTGNYKNTRPNAPIISNPRGEEEHKLYSNSVSINGLYQKGAEKVTLYIDDEAYDATLNSDLTYTLNLTLEDGTHKLYATQTIGGVESTKTADRFVIVNNPSANEDYLKSGYEYDKLHSTLNDNIASYDVYQNTLKGDNAGISYNESTGEINVISNQAATLYIADYEDDKVKSVKTYNINENRSNIFDFDPLKRAFVWNKNLSPLSKTFAISDLIKPQNIKVEYTYNTSADKPDLFNISWDEVTNSSEYILTVFKTNAFDEKDIILRRELSTTGDTLDLSSMSVSELENAVVTVQSVVNGIISDYSVQSLLLRRPTITGVSYDTDAYKYKVSYNKVAGATGYKVRFNGVEIATDTDGDTSTLFEIPASTVGFTGKVEVMAFSDFNISVYNSYVADIAFAGKETVKENGQNVTYNLIADERNFKNIAANAETLGGNYKQIRDIKGITAPIGDTNNAFYGVYDGGNNTITVDIVATTSTDIGLFAKLSGATIKNLKTAGKITNTAAVKNTGGIAGSAVSSSFENVENGIYVNLGAVINNNNTAGFAGDATGGCVFVNCVNNGKINAKYESASGFVGRGGGTFTDCVNYAEIASKNGVAAFVGTTTEDVTIDRCANLGFINGIDSYSYYVGGFIAHISSGNITIKNSYNDAPVELFGGNNGASAENETAAAFIGRVDSKNKVNIVIENCYNTNTVKAFTNQASLVGWITSPVNLTVKNYYDIANTDLALTGELPEESSVTTENVYIEDPVALRSNLPDGFSEDVWMIELKCSYKYPQLINNEHINKNNDGFVEENPILISSPEQFKSYFGANGKNNDFIKDRLYFKQTADINLGEYTPCSEYEFNGVYDANNKTITYTISSTSDANGHGAFARVVGGTIKNLTVAGTLTGNHNYLGGVAGFSDGATFINCTNEVAITTASAGNYLGGITGGNNLPTMASTFTNCVNNANLAFTYGNNGGIAGVAFGTFTGCVNNGEVIGSRAGEQAGILGIANAHNSAAATASVIMQRCVNNKKIQAAYTGPEAVGGMIARVDKVNTVSISECYNTGEMKADGKEGDVWTAEGSMIGRITDSMTGENPSVTISNCYSTGAINDSGDNYTGGAVGEHASTRATLTISNFYDSYTWAFQWDIVGNVASGATTPVLNNAYTVINRAGVTPVSNNPIQYEDIKGKLPAGFSSDIWVAVPDALPLLKCFTNIED